MKDVLSPETITDQPFTSDVTTPTNNPSSGIAVPESVSNQKFPASIIANELLSESLNSQARRILGSYEFGQLGAIQIGKYENGVSGDLRLTPNGITARDINGVTTFSIDGSTGDATFKGQVKAGSVVTNGDVVISGTGAFVVNDGTYNVIRMGYGSGLF